MFSTVTTISFLINGISFFRTMILLAFCMSQGVSFHNAKTALSPYLADLDAPTEKMGFRWLGAPSFVVMGNATHPLVSIENAVAKRGGDPLIDKFESKFKCRIGWIVVPQRGQDPSEPDPTIQDGQFALEKHNWSSVRPKIMGVSLGGCMPGFQFALYRRTSPSLSRTDSTSESQPVPDGADRTKNAQSSR